MNGSCIMIRPYIKSRPVGRDDGNRGILVAFYAKRNIVVQTFVHRAQIYHG